MNITTKTRLGTVKILMLKGEKGDMGDAGDYSTLNNKPSINNVEINGNLTSTDLGLASPADIANLQSDFNALETDVDKLENILENVSRSESLIKLSGDTSGKVVSWKAVRGDTETSVWFGVGSGGINHGMYSDTLGGWLIYADAENVFVNGIKMMVGEISATKVGDYWTGGNIIARRRGNSVTVTCSPTVQELTERATIATLPEDFSPVSTVYGLINGSTDYVLFNVNGTIQMNKISAGTKYFSVTYTART